MAISNQQIVDWLQANPTADDATIAKTMTANGVTASQLANATGADPKNVATRFLTQQILAQGTSAQWKGEGKGSAEANARDMAQIMADTGITDISQFGQITQTIPAREEWQGGEGGQYVTIPEQTITTYGNKATGQAVANTYGERQSGNAFGGTFSGEGNTGYRVQFDAQGNPYFYTSAASSNTLQGIMQDLGPLGNIALAIATGGLTIPQQLAANLAVQVLSGKDIGDAIKNAAISMAVSNIPGSDVMKEANKYIKGLDLPAAVTTTINNAVQNAVTSGAKAALTGQDIGDAMLKGAAAGGTNGAVTAMLKEVDGFGDLTGAQKKMVINAVTGAISGKPLDQLVINAAIATANAEIADQKKYAPLPQDDIDELAPGEKAAYDEGGTKALLELRRSLNTMSKLTGSGRTGDDMGGDYVSDDVLDTLQKAGLTETGLGDQDVTDILNASTLTGAAGNDAIKDTANIDNVDITGAKGNDTLGGTDTITGAGGNDAISATRGLTDLGTTTITGAKGNDTVKKDANGCLDTEYWDPVLESCQLKVLDTVTGGGGNDVITGGGGNDNLTITGKRDANGCLETEYWDPVLESCQLKVADTVVGGGGNDTITGGGGNDEVVITDKKCDPGYVYDEDLKMCVAEKAAVVCDPGFHEENGVCVKDKLVCDAGFHEENGACVKDKLVCDTGYHEENGVCVKDKLTCPPGKVLNADGTACIDEVIIKDKKCDPGFVYDEDLMMCVAEEKPIICDPGFHEENGVCVPDKLVCDAGYHEENGVCVKDKLVCDTGYHEENGVCVKDKLTCPPGKVLNAEGTACIDEVKIVDKKCDPGYVYDEDLKQCVPVDKPIVCDPGYHEENGVCVPDKLVCDAGYHEENGVCVKDKLVCDAGFHEENGVCVADTPKPLKCPEGYTPDETGTKCVPVVEVVDKKCDPGFVYDEDLKMCVPEDKPVVCDPGYHEENGVCVKNKLVCDKGFHEENGVCVADTPEPLKCTEGYEPDATGTKCIPVVIIEDKKCDPGFVYDEALKQCVPVDKPVVCDPGFHEENGVCVPDTPKPIVCETGYHLENGVCVKNKLVCETGFHEENGVCVKDAVTPPPPPPPPKPTTQLTALAMPTVGTYTDTSTTSPVYAGAMDEFDLFATLQDILDSDSNKKATQSGQQTTKMATGGHLDDLLAEQMTVDDLLKLLR